ncbi:Asp-tRNA(Asn)/Glu-tRNA(Gln) amidotransferase subunit GatA [Agrilactobacillus fermenti]|uniref:Asp-tRNA(Asn)/Glu-tRNA(Gln) amidotransferase subunit GatA n=1 Tax=Agrilactobacillus fermenti TaxID=2586909 RepID=UPI001E589847|nr:Asp-tRNA(Asn)/Glu-tRNA(Gln) amidotransferase subunit GatA [Agrilactobacillus fermenti]MCD2255147.1 Asp-tRNA(Asn)/Glu-tRNA(Gln) amidotransferase subunit GatA [Agrilactobacillus fermenti]
MNYFNEDITSLHDKLVNKEITVRQLVEATFDYIEQTDEKINAFITLNKTDALEKADALDAAGIDPDELLAGIPLGIKDNIVTKGLKTTAASHILDNFEPVYNATVMDKLDGQKTITVGKTNLDEFAMGSSTETSYFGETHNPWNLTKVPGGSSGGSAAAVAAGEVIAALGTDTGGSIRQPAAFNGIFGIKPTYGRVSRWGLMAFGSSLDQIGVLSRSIKDSAIILNAISGHDDHDGTSATEAVPDFTKALGQDIKGLKIAVPKEYMDKGIDADVVKAIQAAIKTFESLGATVEEVSLPYTKYAVPAYYIIASSEASSNLQRYDGIRYGFRAKDVKTLEDVYVRSRSEGFGDEVKRRIMLGSFSLSAGYYDAYFKKAAQVRTLIKNDFDQLFEKYDLILGPTTPTPAFGLGEKVTDPVTMYLNDILTIPANLAGIPAASIPAGFSETGLPIGVQLMAKKMDEMTIFKAADAFEQATEFHQAIPEFKGGQN